MAQAQNLIRPDGTQASSSSLWHRIKKARWPYLFIYPFYILFGAYILSSTNAFFFRIQAANITWFHPKFCAVIS